MIAGDSFGDSAEVLIKGTLVLKSIFQHFDLKPFALVSLGDEGPRHRQTAIATSRSFPRVGFDSNLVDWIIGLDQLPDTVFRCGGDSSHYLLLNPVGQLPIQKGSIPGGHFVTKQLLILR